MLAMIVAAAVASNPAPRVFVAPSAESATSVCKAEGRYEIADPALLYRDDGRARLRSLGDLPRANHEKAVMRMIGPCSNPMVVRYGVGR